MPDAALASIATTPREQIDFQWFRSSFGADRGLWDSLDRGHAVLETPEQLDQYLHSYGLMVQDHWQNAAPWLAKTRQPALCIDYGCGQGLAGLIVNDLTNGKLLSKTRQVLLIEPSNVALARATALYGRLAPAATLTSVAKLFDAVQTSEFPAAPTGSTLHLFSNSLDIPGFDAAALLNKALRPGHHTILSVSHDRDFKGGTPRIERIKAELELSATSSGRTIHQSTIKRFTCDNPPNSRGMVWFCELEVGNG